MYAHYFPNIGNTGKYAVFGFYLVSGYLITAVVNTRYNDGIKGLKAFWINRMLRIYPTYITTSLFSLCVILYAPDVASRISPYMHLPEHVSAWIPQFLIFGSLIPFGEKLNTLFIPVGWSLNVELVYYILIAVVLGRSKSICTAWFFVSIVIAIYYGIFGNIDEDYFSYLCASIAFATGGMMYYKDDLLNSILPKEKSSNKLFLMSIFAFSAFVFWPEPIGVYLYVFKDQSLQQVQETLWIVDEFWLVLLIIPFAAVSLHLSLTLNPQASDRLKRFASFCGDLSFPMFLLHWPVLVLVTTILGGEGGHGETRERIYSVFALPVVLILSCVVVWAVDHPLKELRARVRKLA